MLVRKGAESAGVITAAPRADNKYASNKSSSSATAPSQPRAKAGGANKRLSTRDFFDLSELDQDGEDDWEMVLAVGEHPDSVGQRKARVQDIVVKGYEDG